MKGLLPKRISVLGAARSGLASVRFLIDKGTKVFVSDTCSPARLEAALGSFGLGLVPHEAGAHSERVLDADCIIISPGIPSDVPIVLAAKARKIPVWSEIELAYRMCAAPVFVITGSSGKSTTTSLLGSIFAASNVPTVVAGNIGYPAIGALPTLESTGRAVLEVSSFQLENIDHLKPRGAAVLNLMKNHLDRYAGEEEYYAAKMQVARNMSADDVLVVNAHDARLCAWADIMKKRMRVVYFGEGQPSGDGAWYRDGAVYVVKGSDEDKIFDVASMRIRGIHNYLNAAAATAVAVFAGKVDSRSVAAGVAAFRGLSHRLELSATINGVGFYNDSKSTTAESIICALRAFDRGVHLIAGGRDKGCDFALVNDELRQRGSAVYLIGEAAPRIASVWKGLAPIHRAASLREAMEQARANAQPGDAVVLSPGCSSFDMFRDYEDRGEAFKSIARELAQESGS